MVRNQNLPAEAASAQAGTVNRRQMTEPACRSHLGAGRDRI